MIEQKPLKKRLDYTFRDPNGNLVTFKNKHEAAKAIKIDQRRLWNLVRGVKFCTASGWRSTHPAAQEKLNKMYLKLINIHTKEIVVLDTIAKKEEFKRKYGAQKWNLCKVKQKKMLKYKDWMNFDVYEKLHMYS